MNEGGGEAIRGALLHEIFDAVAGRFPDRIAVEIPPGASRAVRGTITYAELKRQSEALAATLWPLVQPDAIVAILLPRDSVDLYAAQLAVLRAGGCFTCIDPKFPDEHLQAVLEDAGAVALITDFVGRGRVQTMAVSVPVIEVNAAAPATVPFMAKLAPANLAYVIYTSGTTGKPKGVLIEHRSIVNLVESDVEYFGLTCDDRVAQCSSPAYDSSIEETWLAFAVGATLVLLNDETVRLGPDLPAWLARERISVLCPPPTLLRATGCADPQRALPNLRLLYVGGEALPADLADLWSAGRWMENGYGPTECTVTVTRARVRPGEAVTIGKPVRGCSAYLLDASLDAVPDGQEGELCIAGASLARGYHGRPELTREKFPTHLQFGRIYRTGDLVRRNAEGDLEYLGRIDAQVKLRGYRIELGAIEAILAGCPGVRGAACGVQGTGAGQILTAHVVPQEAGSPPGVEALKAALRRSLPEYMIPPRFGFLDQLPTSVGGKLNRKALPELPAPAREADRRIVEAQNEDERAIADAFGSALKLEDDVSIHDDFFLDLGGDSLSAVGVICALREANRQCAITVRDLYEARTVNALAHRLREAVQPQSPIAHRQSIVRRAGNPLLCTSIQTLWLMLELVAGGAMGYAVTFELLPALIGRFGLLASVFLAPLLALLGLIAYLPLSVAIVVILKRLLIGRYQATCEPVWGGFYTRHWIVTSAARLIPWWLVEGTIFRSTILRALGAKVGRRVYIHRGVDLARGGWDLLTIGDDVTLAQEASIRLTDLVDGQIVIGPVTLGDGATIDVRGGLGPDSAVAAGGYLAPLSSLPSGMAIGENQRWDGVPATGAGDAPEAPGIDHNLSPLVHGLLTLLGRCVSLFASVLPLLLIIVLSDASSLLAWLADPSATSPGLALTCLLVAGWIMLKLLGQAIALRLMGTVKPGVYSQWSFQAIRIFMKTGMVESASRWLSGAIFWPWWLRMAGMRVGRGSEISTIIDVLPETVRIGRESFFADGIYFCAPWRHRGTITVAESRLGRGTFLGNHAMIPAGHRWADGLFVGVSTPAGAEQARAGGGWFGHPPMELPRREVVSIDRRLTHEPPLLLFLTRLFWELLRFALPALPIFVGYEWYCLMSHWGAGFGWGFNAFFLAPLLTAFAGAAMCAGIVALKWLLLGRMRPGQHAFWSCWCGRWDFLFMAWGFWARGALSRLEGTLWLNAFLRLTGVSIGRRVVLGPGFSQVVDPDMLHFADDATINCHFQAHSFEDRILKLDHIHIGQGASVGEHAVVFYGARIGERASVAPHGVVMKRDVLEPGVHYAGCPTRAVLEIAPGEVKL